MSFTIHSIPDLPSSPLAYFKPEYLQAQAYASLSIFSDDHFMIPVDIIEGRAISIPRSPFGSFYQKKGINLSGFFDQVCDYLRGKSVSDFIIHHPSPIYSQMARASDLSQCMNQTCYTDINQHIDLTEEWETQIHTMQRRKLAALERDGFKFQKIEGDWLEIAHQFLTVCRRSQGLAINISYDLLKSLSETLPDTYECFGVFREEKISALCISVRVTDEVAYYYLPGTSPLFRNLSPMVMLIAGMVHYYREQGFRYLDLGVSSSQGVPQETLRLFKERMGAIETKKPTFHHSLTS